MSSVEEYFGTTVIRYTRQDALDDGVLVDVTEMAKEAGVGIHTACTARLYHEIVVPTPYAEGMGNSVEGRLWDLIWMFTCATRGMLEARKYRAGVCEVLEYPCLFVMDGSPEAVEHTIKAMVGPGDEGEPVLTLMLPGED